MAKYSLQTFLITIFFPSNLLSNPSWPFGAPLSLGGEQDGSAALGLGQA